MCMQYFGQLPGQGFWSRGRQRWGLGRGSLPSGRGFGRSYALPRNLLDFGSNWCILVHFAHCFFCSTHMQRTGIIAQYIGSDVCLSQGHKAVFYQCSSKYHHAISRKLRWTLWRVYRGAMPSQNICSNWKINKMVHSGVGLFCAVILI